VTIKPVCLVLTRPIWKGSEDPLVAALERLSQDATLGKFPRLRVISAPVQQLVAGEDLQACHQLELVAGLRTTAVQAALSEPEPRTRVGLIVATSPSSVDALARMPQTSGQLRAVILAPGRSWGVTGVGHASAQAMGAWLAKGGQTTGSLLAPPIDGDSGADAFLRWVDEVYPLPQQGASIILLEAQENQPTLAEALARRGFQVCRLAIYQRQSVPMLQLVCAADDLLCVLVSSSTVAENVVRAVESQGIDPGRIRWLTHHPLIADRLAACLKMPVVPLLDGLSAKEILSCLARLNLEV
jgi:uroporphyrinogen-III synthase